MIAGRGARAGFLSHPLYIRTSSGAGTVASSGRSTKRTQYHTTNNKKGRYEWLDDSA
jgi:hypothetical protein